MTIGAVAGWLAVVGCAGRSIGVTVGVAAVALLIGVTALLAGGRFGRTGHAVGLATLCVALVLVPFAARLAHARASPLHRLAAARTQVTAVLTVRGDPHLMAGTGVAGPPRVLIDAAADGAEVAGRQVSLAGPVLVLAPAQQWRDLLPGQRVEADGTLQPALDATSLGAAFVSYSAPRLIGRPPWWQRAAGTVRADLRTAAGGLPVEERGLLPGLVDGDTRDLDPVLAERFRLAGLTHLVAVSGTNCSILVGALLLVLRALRVRPWISAVAGGVLLVAFVVVARPSPSVLRAAVMAAIALVSLATGRPRQAMPALAAAVLVLLVWDPTLSTDAGFTMSVLATGALLIIAPGWARALRRHHVPLGVAEAVAVAAAAHLVTAPVIAVISGRVSLVAVPANVLAEPVVAVVTVLGFGAAVLAPVWMPVGRLLAELAGWPCRWLVWVADRIGGLPGAAVAWPGGIGGGLALLAVLVVGVLLIRRSGPGRVLAVGALLAVLVQIPVRSVAPGWPPSGWRLVACDVGQGDALVLPAGPHAGVEIDTGPDPVDVDRCLRDLGIDDIPLLVLTHYHLDHVGGILGAVHGRRVGRVIASPLLEPASGVRLVDDALAARHIPLAVAAAGAQADIGTVHLEVLGPAAAFHGTRSDPNNSSVVLRATVGGTRILLPGDAEVEAQDALLDAGVDLTADVLKVPHHGSAYSDASFLAAVHARIGVISVGAHNDYGHPSPLLLRELAVLGVPVRRTDEDGDVAVVGAGTALHTVVRGTSASSVAGRVAASPWAPAGSDRDARMRPWPSARSVSRTFPIRFRHSCCSSATRSFSSVGRSARSPPRHAAATRT